MKINGAQVAVEGVPYSADRLYTYSIPSDLTGAVVQGSVVLCPFGAGNRLHRAVVWCLTSVEDKGVKPIASLVDMDGCLDRVSLRLAAYLHDKTFCTYFEAVKAVMPPGIFGKLDRYYVPTPNLTDDRLRAYFEEYSLGAERKKVMKDLGPAVYGRLLAAVSDGSVKETVKPAGAVREKTVRTVALSDGAEIFLRENKDKTSETVKKQIRVIDILTEHGTLSVSDLCATACVTDSVIKTLAKKNVVTIDITAVSRDPYAEASVRDDAPLDLSDEQRKAFDEIKANLDTGKSHLLYGVTGSGKTHVYMALIDEVLRRGQSVLMMIPEISITLQTVDIFERRYGADIAVLHSGLNAGERFDTWKRISEGRCRVVIGTRSAVFAPVKNLGLIIIDEEQEHTYLSEMTPKYDAVEMAAFRVREQNILLLCASATPSFERYRAAQEGKIGFSVLQKRYNKKPLPKTLVVDMTKELQDGNNGLISRELAKEIDVNRKRGEQTVLFMNRRGYSSFVSCPQCKFVYKCKSCGIPLTYHRTSGQLVCHYCGYHAPAQDICPECGCKTIKYSGAGTQKVEEELNRLFPGLKILRMDADTVGQKDSREKILQAFRNHEYDVLLGTQMITKGLDFADVTLVGVLMADMMLYSSDFRAYEKTFSVITQVVGRAGRSEKEGRAVIQTYSPTHTVLKYAFGQDYTGFFAEESALRKTLLYPPYCDICQVVFSADSVDRAFTVAEQWIEAVGQCVKQEAYDAVPIKIIRPRETAVPMENGKHRVRVLIKCKDNALTRKMLSDLYKDFVKQKDNKDVTVDMTMNPAVIV